MSDPPNTSTDLALFDTSTLDHASDELFERLLTGGKSLVLLCDTSGSMEFAAGGTPPKGKSSWTRHEAMVDAVKPYRTAKQTLPTFVIAFSSGVDEVGEGDRMPPPVGGTDLAAGLRRAAAKNPARTILISDGEPDSKALAFAEARNLPGVLDVIFVGDDNDLAAKKFMAEIATKCGGTFQDLAGTSGEMLGGAVARLMLPP